MGSLRRNRPLRAFMDYVGLPRLGTARYVLLWSGVAIHLLTIYVGWRLGGWLSAGLSAVFPFAAQAYWILHIWEETDIFFNFLTIVCLGYAVLWLAVPCLKLR